MDSYLLNLHDRRNIENILTEWTSVITSCSYFSSLHIIDNEKNEFSEIYP